MNKKTNKEKSKDEKENNISEISATLTIKYINDRINTEICNTTIDKLKDNNLMNDYKECKSVQKEIKKLTEILEKHKINEPTKKSIIDEYLIELIPAGTKGVIRGNKFNSIVKETINELKLDNDKFEVRFEEQCSSNITTEIPDWYILEKSTGKVIIGMNQLDLWGGGQQINRGSKYLINNKMNTVNSKLLCVVCNKINFSSNKNKAFKLFEVGYSNNTLCYLNGLIKIINDFFNLE